MGWGLCRGGALTDAKASMESAKSGEAPTSVFAASGSAAAAAGQEPRRDLMSWEDDVPDAPVPAPAGERTGACLQSMQPGSLHEQAAPVRSWPALSSMFVTHPSLTSLCLPCRRTVPNLPCWQALVCVLSQVNWIAGLGEELSSSTQSLSAMPSGNLNSAGMPQRSFGRLHSRGRSTVDSLLGDDDAGYLSPLEDTFSILSDDAIPAPPPYVQVLELLCVGSNRRIE